MKTLQEIKNASPSRYQEDDMKTLQEIKDEVANNYGFDKWSDIPYSFFFEINNERIGYDGLWEQVSERYAKQAFRYVPASRNYLRN